MLRRINIITALVWLAALSFATTSFAADAESVFSGSWVVNQTETDKVTVDFDKGGGRKGHDFGSVRITVLGIPVPGTARPPARTGTAPQHPRILQCNEVTIDIDGRDITLIFDQNDKETMRKGEYRGRVTRVSKKKIEQRYESMSRKVTKTWTVRSDGRLLVSVKLNPNHDKSITYNRVFDRLLAAGNQD